MHHLAAILALILRVGPSNSETWQTPIAKAFDVKKGSHSICQILTSYNNFPYFVIFLITDQSMDSGTVLLNFE